MPNKASRHFLSMGLGIERRAARLSAYWNPHLEMSKAAQRRWLETASGEEVAVLGAGRLMDVATEELAGRFQTLWLVDADPLAATYWKNIKVPLRWDVCDVSGVIKDWIRQVEGASGGWKQVLDQVRSLPRPTRAAFLAQAEGIISLNLLSQIPIAWQDLLEQYLMHRFGADFVNKHEKEWMDAMIPGARWLVESHLKMLEFSQAERILIIADVNYVYYRNTGPMPLMGAPMPLGWQDGEWSSSTKGMTHEVVESLFGVQLEDGKVFQALMPNYELEWQQVWLWHISPLGLENKKRGTIHRVGALALRRRVS